MGGSRVSSCQGNVRVGSLHGKKRQIKKEKQRRRINGVSEKHSDGKTRTAELNTEL